MKDIKKHFNINDKELLYIDELVYLFCALLSA